MTPKKAILLTILGILAAWLIIRGIQAWEAKHAADGEAFVPAHAELCLRPLSEGASPAGLLIL